MSFTEINKNTTFDFPNEIKVNKSSNYYNPKSSTISRMKKSQIVYGTGVDDYVFNEIKKAKYQGCFDPGSLGNKNIFNDNQNFRNIYSQSNQSNNKPNLNNIKNQKKNFKKYSNYTTEKIHKHDEGKNLLIEKTEIQYPIKFNKYNYKLIISNRNNYNRNNNNTIDYAYNSSPITIERNYLRNKNLRERNTNYSYYTPINNDRKYINETEVNRNRALVINNLMNNYNESSKIMNKTRNNRYLQYSTDNKNNDSSGMVSLSRENFFSPIIVPNRKTANKTNLNNIKIHTADASYLNNDENILRYSCNFLNKKDHTEKEYIMDNIENGNYIDENNIENNIYSENINNNINISDSNNENNNDIININDNINVNLDDDIKYNMKNKNNKDDNYNKEEIVDKDNDDENKKYLISIYRQKILTLFLNYMGNFYLLHFKNIFHDFISLLRRKTKNKNNYNFEYKTINNISEIKKSLISNSYYYGYNKQYTNLLRDIKNKTNRKNLIVNNKNKKKNNEDISNNKTYFETDYHKKNKESNFNSNANLIKKRCILNNKKIINQKANISKKIAEKKDINKNISNSISISNKKYVKKNISKNIFAKDKHDNHENKIEKKIFNKKEIISEKMSFTKNNLIENKNNDSNQESRNMIKSFDKNPKIKNWKNINKTIKKKTFISYNTSTIINSKNNVKPRLFKKSIPNTLNINNNKKYSFNKINMNSNINNNKLKNSININANTNEENKINKKQKNILHVYDILEGKSSDEKLNMSMKYLEIDSKNMSPRDKNDINQNNFKIENTFVHTFIGNEINKNDINDLEENDNNEENEIFPNNNLENAISIITKIMENKEKDDENKNIRNNLLLKIIQNKINKEKKQNLEIIKKYFDIMKNNDITFGGKSIKKKHKYSMDLLESSKLKENKEGNLTTSKSTGKFRVVIKKIKMHRSHIKDILNDHIKRIKPIKSAKNFTPFITDINNIPGNKFIKKTIALTINKNDKVLLNKIKSNKNNIEKIKNGDKNRDEKNEINIRSEKNEKINENSKNNFIEDEKKDNYNEVNDEKKNNNNLNINNEENANNSVSISRGKKDYNNLSVNSNNDINEENNDIISNSVKNLYRNIKFVKKSNATGDERKSLRNIPRLRKSIESFTKYRKNKSKLNKSGKNENNNEGDMSLNEKYEDYENLIFYLRAQLIYCFLSKTHNNESFND